MVLSTIKVWADGMPKIYKLIKAYIFIFKVSYYFKYRFHHQIGGKITLLFRLLTDGENVRERGLCLCGYVCAVYTHTVC